MKIFKILISIMIILLVPIFLSCTYLKENTNDNKIDYTSINFKEIVEEKTKTVSEIQKSLELREVNKIHIHNSHQETKDDDISPDLELETKSEIYKTPITQNEEIKNNEEDKYTFDELEKLFDSYKTYNISYKSLNFSEFKPNYNLLVSNALAKVGYNKDYFSNWYNQVNNKCLYDEDWPPYVFILVYFVNK